MKYVYHILRLIFKKVREKHTNPSIKTEKMRLKLTSNIIAFKIIKAYHISAHLIPYDCYHLII